MAGARAFEILVATSMASVCLSSVGRAQMPPERDQSETAEGTVKARERRLPTHSSLFVWDHSATAQTVGLGPDYQSRNPTYEMTFRAVLRYYLLEDAARSLSARADVRLVREFTNSDVTTERGEWTFTDTDVWLAYVHAFNEAEHHKSELLLRAPVLTFPTSKVSARSGRILGLGFGLGYGQEIALREGQRLLPELVILPRATYSYQFSQSAVATNAAIDRVRFDSEGRSLPSDQLTGSALSQHQASASLRVDTALTEELWFVNEAGFRYAHRYALPEDLSLTGGVDTGPAVVESPSDTTRWQVSTLFSTGLYYYPLSYLEIGLGYVNLSPQLGSNGRRRSLFNSPDARVFLSFTVALTEAYQTARGETPAAALHLPQL